MTCFEDNCEEKASSRGLCKKHYDYYRYNNLQLPLRINADSKSPLCKIEGCGNVKHYRAMCRKHVADFRQKANKIYREREKELQTEGESYCYKCDRSLPLEHFTKDSSRPRGLSAKCKVCGENARLLRIYGITSLDVIRMLEDQDYSCLICLRDFQGKEKWHVDHDHECCSATPFCGKCNRGLLCRKCNWGLGNFEDRELSLENAINYLRRYK